MENTNTRYGVYGLLAGAYKGGRKSLKATLTHASTDGGNTALCGKVQEYNLCPDYEVAELTCPACTRKLAKLPNPERDPEREEYEG